MIAAANATEFAETFVRNALRNARSTELRNVLPSLSSSFTRSK